MQRSGLLLAALLALLAPVRGEEGRRERPRGVSPCPVGLGEGPLPALRHGARGSRDGRGTEGARAPLSLSFYSFS